MPPQSSLICLSAMLTLPAQCDHSLLVIVSPNTRSHSVDTERVMPQCAVPEVAELLFAGVEPLVYRSVILYLSAEATNR